MCGYLLATILPMFASSVKRVYVFGLVVVVSYVVAELFYREYLVSVWCFFGAIASAVIWWVLKVREPARIAVPETVDP
jgi:predicted benzoate:H+ symporter BenE